jgi:hypothetical protein
MKKPNSAKYRNLYSPSDRGTIWYARRGEAPLPREHEALARDTRGLEGGRALA